MMKKDQAKTMFIKIVSLLVITGICSVAQAQIHNLNVQLELNSGQTALDITTRGNCTEDNHNGCIKVAHSAKARINFSFVGDKKCNRSEGANWKIGDVYLGGKNSEDKPETWGGLDGEVELDFSVKDAGSGLLNKASGSNDQSIIIFDRNHYAYDIWYKVTAVCIDGDGSVLATVESDPRIKNGGNQ